MKICAYCDDCERIFEFEELNRYRYDIKGYECLYCPSRNENKLEILIYNEDK